MSMATNHAHLTQCAEAKPEEDESLLETLLFLSAPRASGTESVPNAVERAASVDVPQGEWDTTSPSPWELRADMITPTSDHCQSASVPSIPIPISPATEISSSPSCSNLNRGNWINLSRSSTPQVLQRRECTRQKSVDTSVAVCSALSHRQVDDKLVPMKEYYGRSNFDGSLQPLDEYYTWSYAEFEVFSPHSTDPAAGVAKHTLGSLMSLSQGGDSMRRHVIPKACSLLLVASDKDLAVFLSDPLHVHAFVCLCCNCLKLHNASRDLTTPKIRLLLKKPNASPHYSKAALTAENGDRSTISYDQRTGYCSLSNPSHPKSVCMLCVPVKEPPAGLQQETVFPIRTSTTNSCGCPRTQLKRAAAVSRQHVAKKIKPSEATPRSAPQREQSEKKRVHAEDEAAMLLRKFSECANSAR